MTRRAEDLLLAISLEEVQDIVDHLGEELGETAGEIPASPDSIAEADAILAKAHAMRALLKELCPAPPDRFTDRIIAAALEADPVPDPAAIHRLPE